MLSIFFSFRGKVIHGWDLGIPKANGCLLLFLMGLQMSDCECPVAAGASAHLPLCWRPTKKQRVNYHGKIGFHHKPSQTIMYHLHSSAMIKGIELQILIHLILTVTDY